jgi:hypothetical protein
MPGWSLAVFAVIPERLATGHGSLARFSGSPEGMEKLPQMLKPYEMA